jgi:glycosyltransferase involved in cell wall biosynthesis
MVASAFARLPRERLLIVGDGPELKRLRERAPGNVQFRSRLSDPQLRWCYEQSVGLIAASFEDFGLTPLEAASSGRPVAALRGGGYLDTIVEGATGLFFEEATTAAIAAAAGELRARSWDEAVIRAHAKTFGADRFNTRLREIVAEVRR